MEVFFNDTATTEIYTLSLHDALPISRERAGRGHPGLLAPGHGGLLPDDEDPPAPGAGLDRKSTRLNSSHANISYAVFCLKKKHSHCHQFSVPQPSTSPILLRYFADLS